MGCHDGNLSLHFSSQNDILDEVSNTIDGGLEIIKFIRVGLIEDL